MLPPFYYKGMSDDGLFAFFSGVIDRVGSAALRIYLYHIPPVAQVGFSLDLVGRLIAAYPQTVVGLKDSSGDWSNTAALLDRFPGFAVFPGSEVFLLDGLAQGRRRLHHRLGQRQCARHPQGLRELARRRRPTRCRPRSRPCARRCRPIRWSRR